MMTDNPLATSLPSTIDTHPTNNNQTIHFHSVELTNSLMVQLRLSDYFLVQYSRLYDFFI